MKKIVTVILLVGSSAFAQGNTYSAAEKSFDACLKQVQAIQAEDLRRFINTHEGQLNEMDIEMYKSDSDIVARIQVRSCVARLLNQ